MDRSATATNSEHSARTTGVGPGRRLLRWCVAFVVAAATIFIGTSDPLRAEIEAERIQTQESASSPLKYHYPEQYQPAIDALDARSGEVVARFERNLAIDPFPAVDVWILPEVNDFFEVTGREGRAPKWAIGLSLGDEQTVIVARDTELPGGAESDLEKTFIHELAHVAVDIAREGHHVPRWFNEGFALSQAREWSTERRQQLTRAASTGALIPLSDLNRDFPAHHNVASLAYAQSFHFVEFLEEHHGEGVTARIMEHLRETGDFDGAVEEATGRSVAALEADWRDELTSKTSWLALLQSEFAIFFVAAVIFAIAWFIRRKRLRRSADAAEEEDAEWSYDKSRYPLPGEPRDR